MTNLFCRSSATIQSVFIAFVVFLRTAHADIVFSIDVDPDTPGIQDVRTIVASSSFQANLLLELTGTSTLDSYRTSVAFDNAGFTYQSGNSIPLANYSPQVGNVFLSFDTIGPFEASANSIGQGAAAPLGPFVIGRFNFAAQNTIGSFSIRPIEVAFLDGSFDNNFNQLNPTFNFATITIAAVPEPSSLALFWIAVGGCHGLRRTKLSRQLGLYRQKVKS